MNRAIPLTLLTLLLACGRRPAPAAGTERADSGSPGEPADGIPLRDVRGVRLIQVPEPVAEGAWYPAEALGDESAQALLTAPVKGIVAAIPVPPGTRVGAGTGLLAIQSPELARLKADWIAARARLERAEAEHALSLIHI